MNELLEAKADIKKAEAKKEQPAQHFLDKSKREELNQAMLEGKTVVLPAMHSDREERDEPAGALRRRRQEKNLQLIKNNQAK